MNNRNNKLITFFLFIFLFISCASYKAKYKNKEDSKSLKVDKELDHSFYLIGDAGNAEINERSLPLDLFEEALNQASKNSTAIFLGDNIYPIGMPKKDSPERPLAEYRLKIQLNALKEFKGNSIFIPGNHDWYNNGVKGLKRQEKIVEKALGENSFLPKNGCGIDNVNINDNLILVTIDSKWFLTDWNNHPTINENCTIRTRERFLDELSKIFKKNRFKNIIVAMHHPLYSNGPHGGSFSFKDHMTPFPILGTLKNTLRSHIGIQTDNFNKSYHDFINKIQLVAEDFKNNIVFVSGHEHNLQYIENNGFKQVVSGSGSKQSPALIGYGALFTYGNHGYAKLNFYKDGSAVLEYYSANKEDKNKLLFSRKIINARAHFSTKEFDFSEYNEQNDSITTSIYPTENTNVNDFHKFFWGNLHRGKYGTKVKVPVLDLKNTFGGLKPIRRGGGNQTNSLRLEDKNGKQYVLRSMVKDGSRIMGGILKGTFLINVVQDIFTMSHPYAAFVIPDMAKSINIYHTNPRVYYMPKQPLLGSYNNLFGGGMYLLEERPAKNRDDVDSFGNSKKIISTFDILEKIRKNGKHHVDQRWVIRSRLFDMIIGDWDRHEDQWRWASFKTKKGTTYYRPIPRDRDQPFSKFDGIMIPIFKQFTPLVKNMQSFDYDIKDMKWYNNYPRFFDTEFLNKLNLKDWLEEAAYVQEKLTDSIIESSIKKLPKEIFAIDGKEIIKKIKSRRNKLKGIAKRYYNKLSKTIQIVGTDKNDIFTVNRINNQETRITIIHKKDTIYKRSFFLKETKEIQLYGLKGKDLFKINGKVKNGILIRLIGGQDNDTYIDNSLVSGWNKKTKIYDFKSKKNSIKKSRETADLSSNNYYKNTYNHRDLNNNTTIVLPNIGSNPDDGIFFGTKLIYTRQGFKKRPFSSKHDFSANYYSGINGYDFEYNGEFNEAIGNWNLALNFKVTSDNYAINFFGWGNLSRFNQNLDLDFYRVKRSEVYFSPSLLKRFRGGNSVELKSLIEGFEVQNTLNRNIYGFNQSSLNIFKPNYFIGSEVKINHNRIDQIGFPTKGMNFEMTIGVKGKLNEINRGFGYFKSALAIYQNLISNRSLVFASELGTQINIGNQFEFYQGATLGGDRTLRGFNRQRFTGKESFYHSNDLRLRFGDIKSTFLPLKAGMTLGFDYGRVWTPLEIKNTQWHTSYGGSLWLNAIESFTLNLSYFKGNFDENRISFSLGFNF